MNYFIKLRRWIVENKLESGVIVFIILLAAFLRFYKIDEYMTFLGDEGRDMLIMRKIWIEGDIPFIGPPMSVGGLYLGPLYYYLIAIATGIFWLNPIAAAGMNALFGIATAGLIYYLGRSWFGRIAGTISAFLYALSPVTIIYSKSSWNPNPGPFFALLAVLGIYKVHRTGNMLWLILTGAAFAFAVNMHYLSLLLGPVLLMLWIYELLLHSRGKLKRKNILLGTTLAVMAFLVLMSPLFLFEVKHNFPNYYALKTLFSAKDSAVKVGFGEDLVKIWPIYSEKLVGRYIAGFNYSLHILISVLVLVPLVWAGIKKLRAEKLSWPFLALGVWLLIGFLGFSFYKQEVYDHYLNFLNPVPFLLLGALAGLILSIKSKPLRFSLSGIYCLIIGIVLISMVQRSPLKDTPNRQFYKTMSTVSEVLNNSDKKSFNFALIAKSNYDSAYQFIFINYYNVKPGQLPFEKTDQLFVVCEDEVCQPINNPKYEIAAFGMSRVEWMKDFEGIKLYKLIANPNGNLN